MVGSAWLVNDDDFYDGIALAIIPNICIDLCLEKSSKGETSFCRVLLHGPASWGDVHCWVVEVDTVALVHDVHSWVVGVDTVALVHVSMVGILKGCLR